MSTVTATKWGFSTTQTSSSDPTFREHTPYRITTLGVVHLAQDEPNEWGGVGRIHHHPQFDGLVFQSPEAARGFGVAVGLLKPYIHRPVEQWLGAGPHGPDPADDDIVVHVG